MRMRPLVFGISDEVNVALKPASPAWFWLHFDTRGLRMHRMMAHSIIVGLWRIIELE